MNKTGYFTKHKRGSINIAVVYITLLVVIILGFSACNNNKTESTNETGKEQVTSVKEDTSHTDDDTQFLMDVAEINLKEIKLGQLAQQIGLMPCVKEMGN